jgi:quinoprotein glucose dehydrogenase
MSMKMAAQASLAVIAALSFAWACGANVGGSQTAAAPAKIEKGKEALYKGEWPYWGGDPQSTRYTPLNQINKTNLDKLEIAWRWTADGSGDASAANYKATPLMVDGVLYVPWIDNGAAAIDAATGKTLWTFRPPTLAGGRSGGLASRSLSYWSNGTDKRLFHNTMDGRLLSIDAKTGKLDAAFGKNGWVNLRDGVADEVVRDVSSVSPAIVVGDVVIAQIIPAGGRNKASIPGVIRAFDVRSGKLLWTENPIPKPGEPGSETWKNGANLYTGHAGTWTMMSADPELGYLYIPHETPTNEFYGGQRLGDDLYGETLQCVDAKTGKEIWHFQTVHHGLWDYDLPTAPILHDITVNGKKIKAVTQLTKQGLIFVFNRVTGEPIWPIVEKPVPQNTTIPGEVPSKTQPFPTKPEAFLPLTYSDDQLADFTPAIKAEAKRLADQYTKGPLYTLPTEVTPTNKGTWIFPGTGGGPNWNGASVDPVTGVMYTPLRLKPQYAGLRKGDPKQTDMTYYGGGGGAPIEGPFGLPILKPPYSELVATDMNKGEHLWRVPIGGAPDFVRNNPQLKGLNLDFDHMGQFDVRPSPLLTPQVLFMGEGGNLSGGSGGPMFRAWDKTTGKVVWEKKLPNIVTGGPMTYMVNGKQYIAVVISSRGKPAEVIALTLGDGKDDAGVAEASAAPAGVLSKPRPVLNATAEELAMGRDGFARTCALCHGVTGQGIPGGTAPPLTDQVDVAKIARVITNGQGEMSSLAAALKPEEIQAVSKFVASGMPAERRGPPQRGGN